MARAGLASPGAVGYVEHGGKSNVTGYLKLDSKILNLCVHVRNCVHCHCRQQVLYNLWTVLHNL